MDKDFLEVLDPAEVRGNDMVETQEEVTESDLVEVGVNV